MSLLLLILLSVIPAHANAKSIPFTDRIPSGGVLTTIVINVGLSLLMIITFLLCLRPLLAMYNNDKKRTLLERVRSDEREVRHCERERQKGATRLSIVGSVMRPWSGLRRYQLQSLLHPPMKATSWLRDVIVSMAVNIWIPHKKNQDMVKWCDKYSPRVASYLLLQQYMILALVLCSVLTIPLLTPLHALSDPGTSEEEEEITLFTRTSIVMVLGKPWTMLAHAVLAPLFLIIFFVIASVFRKQSSSVMNKYIHQRNEAHSKERRIMEESGISAQTPDVDNDQEVDLESEDESIPLQRDLSFPSIRSDLNSELYQEPEKSDVSIESHSPNSSILQHEDRNEELKHALQKHKSALPGHEVFVSQYTLQIIGLPQEFNKPSQFDRVVKKIFSEEQGFKVVRSFLLLDVSTRLYLDDKLKDIDKSLEHYQYLQDMRPQSRKIHQYQKEEQKFRRKHEHLRQKIANWEREYERAIQEEPETTICGSGRGFILFDSPKDIGLALDIYAGNSIKVDLNELMTPDERSSFALREGRRGSLSLFALRDIRRGSTISSLGFGGVTGSSSSNERGEKRIVRLKICQAEEPGDYVWKVISQPRNAIFSTGRNIMFHVFLIAFLFFFSTPTALFSAVQSVLSILFFQLPIQWIALILGPLGDIIFAWTPAVTLHFLAIALGMIIKTATKLGYFSTKTQYKNLLTARLFGYQLLGVFVLPGLALTSAEGVLTFIMSKERIVQVFRSAFLPSVGTFFCNVLLHNALLKNAEDLFNIDDMVEWGFKTLFYTDGHLGRRAVTPRERLSNAEFQFGFPKEYASMMVSLCIVLTFSLLSPLILIAGLAYFTLKHVIDRFTIDTVFLQDTEFHTTSHTAHAQHLDLIHKLVLFVLCMFAFILWGFFLFRLPIDLRFLPHVACTSVCLIVTTFLALKAMLITPLVTRTKLSRILRKRDHRKQVVKMSALFASKEFDGSWLRHAYTPPYQFIKDIHERAETTSKP